MTYSVVFSETSVAQLEALRRYITSVADSDIAEHYVDAVVDHCLGLNTFPHRGVRRDDLRPGLRTMSYRKRVDIAFVVHDAPRMVTVLGVFYGGQDFGSALESAGQDI